MRLNQVLSNNPNSTLLCHTRHRCVLFAVLKYAADYVILKEDNILSKLSIISADYIIYYPSEVYMAFIWETPEEINLEVAKRLRLIRKRRGFSQEELSRRSNVSYGSIKRFETTGHISLISLTKLCTVLECIDDIKRLFTDIEYRSIDEVLRETKRLQIAKRRND